MILWNESDMNELGFMFVVIPLVPNFGVLTDRKADKNLSQNKKQGKEPELATPRGNTYQYK